MPNKLNKKFKATAKESAAENRASVLGILTKIPYEAAYTSELKWSLKDDIALCNFGDKTDAERFVYTYLARAVPGATQEAREKFFEQHENRFEITRYTQESNEEQVSEIDSKESFEQTQNYVTLKVPLDLINAEALIKALRVIYNNGLYIGDRQSRPLI